MNNKRVMSWDVIKGFAIFLVVWGHCLQYFTTNEDAIYHHDMVFDFIYSFHMPLFMMVSGYFSMSIFKSNLVEIIMKKGRQLYIPSVTTYFIVGVALLIFRHAKFFIGMKSLLGFCWSSYWFLKALFIFYVFTTILVIAWRKSRKSVILLVVLGGAIVPTTWLNFVHCMSMYPYFLFGILLNRKEKWFFNHSVLIGLFSTAVYLLLVCRFRIADYDMYVYMFDWKIDALTIFFLRILIGICGSLAVIIIIRIICGKVSRSSTIVNHLAMIGTNTLGIYVFSRMIVLLVNKKIPHLFEQLNPFKDGYAKDVFYDWGLCVAATILIVYICILLVNIIRKNKYIMLVVLGEK